MKSTKDSLLEDIKAEFAEVNAMMEALNAVSNPRMKAVNRGMSQLSSNDCRLSMS